MKLSIVDAGVKSAHRIARIQAGESLTIGNSSIGVEREIRF